MAPSSVACWRAAAGALGKVQQQGPSFTPGTVRPGGGAVDGSGVCVFWADRGSFSDCARATLLAWVGCRGKFGPGDGPSGVQYTELQSICGWSAVACIRGILQPATLHVVSAVCLCKLRSGGRLQCEKGRGTRRCANLTAAFF